MKESIFKLILLTTILLSSKSYCCSCIGKNSIKNSIKNSDAIFKAKIISKKQIIIIDSLYGIYDTLRRIEYEVLVEEVYKGKINLGTNKVITGEGSGDCGFSFKINEEYLIYSNFSNKYFQSGPIIDTFLETNICTRTKLFNLKESKKVKRKIKFS